MKYDFDEVIERRGTDCLKWDAVQQRWGRNDLLPLWVADMDFRTPPCVMNALRRRLEHEILGYTLPCAEWSEAICRWLERRHDWKVSPEELTFIPGVVRGQAFVLQCFTQPGDKVVVMTPVYHPFFLVTEAMGRTIVRSPLLLQEGQYQIDFDRLRADMQGCKVLILCNPHNPGGRVWTVDELRRIADICEEQDVLVISDEIHCDLTFPPYKHHPFVEAAPRAAVRTITLMAPSKALNMPGLGSSFSVIQHEELNRRFQAFMEAGEFNEGHCLAYLGTAAAYAEGEEWLEQMLDYVKANIDYTEQFLAEHIPSMGMIRPQASYLIYLDCRKLHLPQPELVKLFVEKAHLALNDGTVFGPEGEGFMRLNVGCPRSILAEALQRLEQAVK